MTATFVEVLADVKTRVRTISSFVQVHDKVPDSFSGPCAVVQAGPGDFIAYDPSMGSESCDYRIYITLFVPEPDAVTAQTNLYPYLAPSGTSSVRAAVAGRNNTLFTSYAVEKATNLRPVIIGTETPVRYLACDVVVRVTA